MKRLSAQHIKQIHSLLIAETGGLDGIRDEGLLESALNSPFQTFDDVPLYKTIEAKAARLGYSLVNNHPFIDGNKRTGMMAMLLFLELNGAGGIVRTRKFSASALHWLMALWMIRPCSTGY